MSELNLRDANHLRFIPLMGDLLAGDFQPPSDPKGCSHNLGVLAYASVLKGDKLALSPHAHSYHYPPSWAPNVSVISRCESHASTGYDENLVTLTSLSLFGPEPHYVDIAVDPQYIDETEPVQLYVRDHQGESAVFTLELGDGLAIAKTAITRIAQDFFNLAASIPLEVKL